MILTHGPTERDKLLFYDGIADSFDAIINRYDLDRRLQIVFQRFLSPTELVGRSVLDVGSGTGWFSQRAAAQGAQVVALDIGLRLLAKVREKCAARVVGGDACCLPFPDSTFDVVISSECIEHTLDPRQALREMHRVLRPEGTLVLTVPNRLWHFSATVAATFKLRPYEGFEHWVGWRQLETEIARLNMRNVSMLGFHLFPPVVRATWPLLRRLDPVGERVGPIMLNIAVKARK
jgi:SAM-dependent methyltransferase